VTSLIVEVAAKRLELLHDLLPTAKVPALLVNPDDRALAQAQARELLSAARNRKLELHVLNARSEKDFDAVFADVKRLRVSGLVISPGSVFYAGINKLAALTARHAVPAIWQDRDFPAAGGLMSYGSNIRQLPLGRRYRQGSQGRKSCRIASRAGNQVCIGHQSQNS